MTRKQRPEIEVLESRECLSASIGLQFVGLSNTHAGTDANAAIVASLIKSSGAREVEVSSLPFEFAAPGKDPFANVTQLVQQALPAIPAGGHLKIDLDVKYFPHDNARAVADQNAFWAAWETWPRASATTAAFLNRVARIDGWISCERAWAAQRNLGDQLEITLVPVLEDTDTSRMAYTHLVNAINGLESADGVANVNLRRSCLVDEAFRVAGTTLELHGTWAQVGGMLRSGDTWSNDGTYHSLATFQSEARAALSKGVSALYWLPGFNGTPHEDYNQPDRLVTPFTGPDGDANRADVLSVLRMGRQ
jgi:hypothetical protein